MFARRVHAIREKHDGLAPLDAVETLFDDPINGVVEFRPAARMRAPDSVAERAPVARRLGEYSDLIVERDDEHAIFRAQLFDERDGRVLYLVQLEMRRAARIQHERDGEGLLDRCEIADLLLDIVLEDTEILFLQIRDESPVPVHNAHRNRDERRVDADQLIVSDLFVDITLARVVAAAVRRGTRPRAGRSRRRCRRGRIWADAACARLREDGN